LEKAAEVKTTQNLSLADAWIVACAQIQAAILVHKDPELVPVACEQIVGRRLSLMSFGIFYFLLCVRIQNG